MSDRSPLILVAEDSTFLRRMVVDILTRTGYEVLEAADGAQAFALVLSRNPDLLLLDREMPRVDGLVALDALRRSPRHADLPVIFLTGRDRAGDVAEGLARGAVDYLRKPIEPVELLARVDVALRMRALQAALAKRNAQLEELLVQDPLTGVGNRRRASEALLRDQTSGVVLADVDRFKAVNDTYGHDVGDEVLCEIARRMADAAPESAEVCRWGGEEFLVVLAGDPSGAVAARVVEAVGATPVPTSAGPLEVSISAGASEIGVDGWAEAVRRADAALFGAKHAGRGQALSASAA